MPDATTHEHTPAGRGVNRQVSPRSLVIGALLLLVVVAGIFAYAQQRANATPVGSCWRQVSGGIVAGYEAEECIANPKVFRVTAVVTTTADCPRDTVAFVPESLWREGASGTMCATTAVTG